MSCRSSLLLILALCLLPAQPGTAQEAGRGDSVEWVTQRDEGGVQLLRREGESDGPRFRAKAEFDAGLFEILAVLADDGRRTEWMPRCIESRALKVTPKARVIYTRTEGDWPVSDRDAVVRSRVTITPTGERAQIDLEAIDWPELPPVDGAVRMPELSGQYLLESISPEKTRVSYQVTVDLGGRVPGFVIAFVSEDMPFDSVAALRDQVATTRGSYVAEIATMRADLPAVSSAP